MIETSTDSLAAGASAAILTAALARITVAGAPAAKLGVSASNPRSLNAWITSRT